MDELLQTSIFSASIETKRQENALDIILLKTHVEASGYTIKCNVQYDGNCFFMRSAFTLDVQRPQPPKNLVSLF